MIDTEKYLIGKLEKLDDGRWCIRLNQYNNIGFFIHPYEDDRDDLIENEYYSFSLQTWNSETSYCAFGLNIANHEN